MDEKGGHGGPRKPDDERRRDTVEEEERAARGLPAGEGPLLRAGGRYLV